MNCRDANLSERKIVNEASKFETGEQLSCNYQNATVKRPRKKGKIICKKCSLLWHSNEALNVENKPLKVRRIGNKLYALILCARCRFCLPSSDNNHRSSARSSTPV